MSTTYSTDCLPTNWTMKQVVCVWEKGNKSICRMITSIKLDYTFILIISYHWMLFFCTISPNEGVQFYLCSKCYRTIAHYQYSKTCLSYQSSAITKVWEITIQTLSNNGCHDCLSFFQANTWLNMLPNKSCHFWFSIPQLTLKLPSFS